MQVVVRFFMNYNDTSKKVCILCKSYKNDFFY